MFLTRSIRRKLIIGLMCVMVMLGVVAAAGTTGLLSYRAVVLDLQNSCNSCPLRGELIEQSGLLIKLVFESQDVEDPEPLAAVRARIRQQAERLDLQMHEAHKRLQASGPIGPSAETRGTQQWYFQSLLLIQNQLLQFMDMEQQWRFEARQLDQTNLMRQAVRIQQMLRELPASDDGVARRVSEAAQDWKYHFYVVAVSAVLVVLLLVALVGCGYRWIFRPIKQLHEAAVRVALGDFSYRAQVSGHDEMATLASAFNEMTQRFQETQQDLNRQVNERSRQLVRSERLAGIGFLAAGVAHEINNPLQAISQASESLSSRVAEFGTGQPLSSDDQRVMEDYLGMIQREAFRCQQITSRLLDFGRGHDAPRSRQDLTRLVHEVVEMVGHLGKFRGHKIQFQRQQPCLVEVQATELKQVILNLLTNGLESMDKAGLVRIDLQEYADEVILTLVDTGCGMTPQVMENLFEPFFTARKTGQGTGLGLSITHRIVTDHGGRIEVSSDGPGRGSTFRVHLPRPQAMRRAA